jgi:tRNA modification GTPase
MPSDTIFALASGSYNKASLCVYRISGPQTRDVFFKLTQKTKVIDRRASRCKLFDTFNNLIDDTICIYFIAPNSFTGEDVLELHTHGGVAVSQAIVSELTLLGARPAEPGEFSKRAFLNGKIDLSQAEAIMDIVNAETSAQRRLALQYLEGHASKIYHEWRNNIIRLLAFIETSIDFSEEDIPSNLIEETKASIVTVVNTIDAYLLDGKRGEKLKEGLNVSIIGPPNAGKSSILNYLAGRSVAIVSEIPGTTRDLIEIHLDLKGYPVNLIDSAGIRETKDEIEIEGINRAINTAKKSDLIMIVLESKLDIELDIPILSLMEQDYIIVLNKIDLFECDEVNFNKNIALDKVFKVSAKNGNGINELLDYLTAVAQDRLSGGYNVVIANARHRISLEKASQALKNSLNQDHLELMAEEMRTAAFEIARITGAVDIEDILNVIFSEFCIGK